MEICRWGIYRYSVVRAIVSLYRFFGGSMKAKIIISLGYRKFVLDLEKATKVIDLLSDAEMYESKYHGSADGNPSYNTHHVYANEDTNQIGLELMPEAMYALAKLAGKPTND